MRTLLTTLIIALMTLTSTSAFAEAPVKPHGKGVKIYKQFGPQRAAKLKKWQEKEVARKKRRTFKQYFSGNKLPRHRRIANR